MEATVLLIVTNKQELEPWVTTHGDKFQLLEIRGLLTNSPTQQQIDLIVYWAEDQSSHRIVIVDSRKTRSNGTNDYAMSLAVAVANRVTVPVQVVWMERKHQHRQVIASSQQPVQLNLAV